MAVNFNNPSQVEAFRQKQLDKGIAPEKVEAFISGKQPRQLTVEKGDTLSGIAKREGSTVQEIAMQNKIENPDVIQEGQALKIGSAPVKQQPQPSVKSAGQGTGKVLGKPTIVNQAFWNYNPGIYKEAPHRNRGTDFKAAEGTTIAAPPGEWVAEKAGRDGLWGNSIVLRNRATGETIRFSHLSKFGVRPGEIVKGGKLIGRVGSTGRTTGPRRS